MELSRKLVCRLALVLALSFSPIANAAPIDGINAALDARDEVIAALSSTRQIRYPAQDAMNAAVGRALEALRQEGYESEARSYGREWERDYSDFLLRESLFGIGDHAPLLDFLVDFYATLETTLGKKAAHAGILGDIYDLNYAIPVAFTPVKGKWRTGSWSKDAAEYRVHFTPLADVAIYWGSLLACKKVLAPKGQLSQAKKLCPFVAGKLREISHLYVGPKLADIVFSKANGHDSAIGITDRDLVYVDGVELLDEYEGR
jgi:hypothetical protein